jgi:hypothetical protein
MATPRIESSTARSAASYSRGLAGPGCPPHLRYRDRRGCLDPRLRRPVRLDGEVLFSRRLHGRFPEPRETKELIRDRIAPGIAIGHEGGERPT